MLMCSIGAGRLYVEINVPCKYLFVIVIVIVIIIE